VTVRDLVDGDDRADLRLGRDGEGKLYLPSKQDDTVRQLRSVGSTSPEADEADEAASVGCSEGMVAFDPVAVDLAPLG